MTFLLVKRNSFNRSESARLTHNVIPLLFAINSEICALKAYFLKAQPALLSQQPVYIYYNKHQEILNHI